jgi:hypothetical protein
LANVATTAQLVNQILAVGYKIRWRFPVSLNQQPCMIKGFKKTTSLIVAGEFALHFYSPYHKNDFAQDEECLVSKKPNMCFSHDVV